MPSYIELHQLRKCCDTSHGPLTVVEDFTLNMPRGETVCLMGPKGCGKSTILSMVAGLIPTTAGTVIVAHREVEGPGPDRGILFQSPCLMPWMTALENVSLGLEQIISPQSKSHCNDIASHYLRSVGLAQWLYRRVSDMTPVMQWQVGLARAFALQPKLLLLDEPFQQLDAPGRDQLHSALQSLLAQDGVSALIATTDVDEALCLGDRVVVLTSGPATQINEILSLPTHRPRTRTGSTEDSQALRHRLTESIRDNSLPVGTQASLDANEPTSSHHAKAS